MTCLLGRDYLQGEHKQGTASVWVQWTFCSQEDHEMRVSGDRPRTVQREACQGSLEICDHPTDF